MSVCPRVMIHHTLTIWQNCDGGVDVSDGRSSVAEGGGGGARGRGVAGLMGLAKTIDHTERMQRTS